MAILFFGGAVLRLAYAMRGSLEAGPGVGAKGHGPRVGHVWVLCVCVLCVACYVCCVGEGRAWSWCGVEQEGTATTTCSRSGSSGLDAAPVAVAWSPRVVVCVCVVRVLCVWGGDSLSLRLILSFQFLLVRTAFCSS